MPHTDWKVADATTPLVSPVVGEGADAHRLVRVGEWQLTHWLACEDGEPRMRDIDGAERLGFKEPRMVRKLIRRTFGENLPGIYERSTVERSQTPTGGAREYEVTEYWLTEAQWLKVIARCRTDVAEAILDDMIRVYMLARRGLLPGHAGPMVDIVAALRDALAPLTQTVTAHATALAGLVERVDKMQARLDAGTYPPGLLGDAEARKILDGVASAADCYHARKTRPWTAKRKELELKVKRAAQWNDRALAMQNPAGLTAAWQKLGELTAEARAHLAAHGDPRQTSLPLAN